MCFHARLKGRTENEGLSGQKSGNGQRTENEMVNVRKSVSVLKNEDETARKRIKKKNWGEKTYIQYIIRAPAKEKQSYRKAKESH